MTNNSHFLALLWRCSYTRESRVSRLSRIVYISGALEPVQSRFSSIDVANGDNLNELCCLSSERKLIGMLVFNDFWILDPTCSVQVQPLCGGTNTNSICTLNPPSASPWIELCPFLFIRVSLPSPITPAYIPVWIMVPCISAWDPNPPNTRSHQLRLYVLTLTWARWLV